MSSATETILLTTTVAATGNVTANRFVTVAGTQAGAAANTLGVAKYAATIGQYFPAAVLGMAIAEAGAAIALGDAIETDADGKAVPRTTGPVVGRALQAAASAGKMISILLIPN